ncbi:MAG: hypothetical protein ACYC5H_10285 [Methylovirgula sp.]
MPSGVQVVAGNYQPETVTTIAALRERAALYGCEEPLRTGLDWLRRAPGSSRRAGVGQSRSS